MLNFSDVLLQREAVQALKTPKVHVGSQFLFHINLVVTLKFLDFVGGMWLGLVIRREDVFGSESLCFSILRINGRNILEQEEEKRIVRVRGADSEVV